MSPAVRRQTSAHCRWTLAAGTAALLTLAWLVVAQGIATAWRATSPDDALRLVPTDSRALAARAAQTMLVGDLTPDKLERAREYARDALSRDPLLPAAWRTIALTEPPGSKLYLSALRFSEALSRRDPLTQLALLETEVGRDDIEATVHHYDIILRTTTDFDASLFPVLTSALSEPAILEAVAKRVMTGPIWRRRFTSYIVNVGTSYDLQANFFAALRRHGKLPDRDIVAASVTNAMNVGAYDEASRMYRLIAPAQAAQLLRNGEFEQPNGIPPFDWQLATDDILRVAVSGVQNERRLEVISARGDGGMVARQYLMLPAGTYRLQARFGMLDGTAAGWPYFSIACAKSGTSIATINATRGTRQFGGVIEIPADCRDQWLNLRLRQNVNGDPIAAWINGVVIATVR